jgi:hypothetical protein
VIRILFTDKLSTTAIIRTLYYLEGTFERMLLKLCPRNELLASLVFTSYLQFFEFIDNTRLRLLHVKIFKFTTRAGLVSVSFLIVDTPSAEIGFALLRGAFNRISQDTLTNCTQQRFVNLFLIQHLV